MSIDIRILEDKLAGKATRQHAPLAATRSAGRAYAGSFSCRGGAGRIVNRAETPVVSG